MSDTKLKDVAIRAGVSMTTASLVLSGKGRISQEVRRQVLSTAEELGYKKKSTPASEKETRSSYIGILHYTGREFEWCFIRPIVLEIEKAICGQHRFPVVFPVEHSMDSKTILERIKSSEVRAVFTIHYTNTDLFEELENSGIPVVIVNNSELQDRYYSVCVDNFEGAYEGVQYLTKLGHREIAFVEYSRPESPNVVADRFVGFKKGIDEYKLSFPNRYRLTLDFPDVAMLEYKLKQLFLGKNRPTAVFTHDDYLAARVLFVLEKLGLRVPEEVSVISPGDMLDYEQPFVPRITTMRINTIMVGRLAGQLMLERLQNRSEEIHTLKVKEHLVKRGSCRAIES